jgi:enterochelin esterase-like enzyme
MTKFIINHRMAIPSALVIWAALVNAPKAAAQFPQRRPTPNDALQSAERLDDNRVTFRIYAPKASEVSIVGDWIGQGLADGGSLEKDAEGAWSITVGPLPADLYSYSFIVDGVKTLDPKNPLIKQGIGGVDNMVFFPGEEATFEDNQSVPHGVIRNLWYQSTTLGTQRRMHVYTPPDYENSDDRYPVFYLLHGGGDEDSGWSTIGRAGFILDNLLAAGKAAPMLIVMPNGSLPRPNISRDAADFAARFAELQDRFAKELLNDVVPLVEKSFRVKAGAKNRALAGLSMGGGQTLRVLTTHPDTFAFVGIWSAGLFRGDADPWEQENEEFLAAADKVNDSIERLEIVVGDQDFALNGSKALSEVFKKRGIKHDLRITGGGHTWINWRQYLRDLGPHLFRENSKLSDRDSAGATPVGITGKWTAKFDTQIGEQDYAFDLKFADGRITGTAQADIAGDQYESQIIEGTVDGGQVRFIEDLDFQGNSLRIEYSGTLANKELKLNRKVGDFATEQLVARRLDEPAEAAIDRSESFAVTIDKPENGTIDLDPPLPDNGKYKTGTVVTVRAQADDGFELDSIYYSVPGRWGAMYHESLIPEFEITIDQEKRIGASFIKSDEVAHINVKHDVVYAKPGNKPLKYDVYSPKGAKGLPIIVIIHGGGWSTNDEDIMRGLARELTKDGKFVVCSVDYRWIGDADGDEEPNSMANLIEDVFGAIAHIMEHATEYGGDASRIGVTGDSAGGHLSASAAILIERIGDAGFGVTEGVFEFKPTYLPNGKSADDVKKEMLTAIKAAAPSYGVFAADALVRFQEGLSPGAAEAIAPQSNIPAVADRAVPQYLLRGTSDFLIRDEDVAAFAEALKEQGQTVLYEQVEGAGHAFFDWKPNAEVKATFTKYGVPYAAKMKAFFERHLVADD